jgi:monovalent cation:H+ antiporter-2, CPA2 family
VTTGAAVLAATTGETARAFIEVGTIILVLSLLARLAGRLGISAVPFYLLGGLALGDGGLMAIDVSAEFISLAAEIGVLLLLLTLGLEYSDEELRDGLRHGTVVGLIDGLVNFLPGLAAGLLLGWSVSAALLLGGVTWVSSSGVISKVLADLGRLGNRETPAVLNLLVFEDLAMAVYLPVVAAIVVGGDAGATAITVAVALVAVGAILAVVMRWGSHLSRLLGHGSDEALLLGVFGITLLVSGLAQQLQVSAAIGAFLVGLALSGPVQLRASALMEPLRDLFAAAFFVFFSFQIELSSLVGVLLPAMALTVVTAAGKLISGWMAAARIGVAVPGRLRAGTALIARGEFSIVIAALGVTLVDGPELGAMAAAYVLLTALLGPVATKFAHRVPVPARFRPRAPRRSVATLAPPSGR